ncbi:hypothetical protein Q5752_002884 [Cryptotrichosporon argae]
MQKSDNKSNPPPPAYAATAQPAASSSQPQPQPQPYATGPHPLPHEIHRGPSAHQQALAARYPHHQSSNMVKGSDVLLIIIAIIFPPAAAIIITGCCSCDVLINVLLTCLGYLPGHIHAFWLIYKRIKAEELYGRGGYSYLGNGEFVGHPNAAPVGGAQQPYYGSTQ